MCSSKAAFRSIASVTDICFQENTYMYLSFGLLEYLLKTGVPAALGSM